MHKAQSAWLRRYSSIQDGRRGARCAVCVVSGVNKTREPATARQRPLDFRLPRPKTQESTSDFQDPRPRDARSSGARSQEDPRNRMACAFFFFSFKKLLNARRC
jgi:hypothetical protein